MVSNRRKQAVESVHCIIALYAAVKYIKENRTATKFDSPKLKKFERKRYPFNLKELGWETWMWKHIFENSIWRSLGKVEYPLNQILGMEEELLKKVRKHVRIQTRKTN